MDNESRKLPQPPSFDFDVDGTAGYALPLIPREQLPWVPQVIPHTDSADSRIFASFLALDRPRQKVWLIRGLLAFDQDGGPVVLRQLTFEPYDDPVGSAEITSVDVRELRLGSIRDRAVSQLMVQGELPATMFPTADAARAAREAAAHVADADTRGRPVLTDEHHEQVARAYIEIFEAGTRRGILNQLAQRLGAPRETVRDWVSRARDAGFLAPTKQGRAYGAPGPRLLAINSKERKEKNHG